MGVSGVSSLSQQGAANKCPYCETFSQIEVFLCRRSVEMLEHVLESQVYWFPPDRLGKHAVLKKG